MQRQPNRTPRVVSRRLAHRKQLGEEGVVVPRPREVNAYLRQHPDLAALAPSLCADARREFGGATELSLELYRDPEVEDSYLTLYIRQRDYDTDLLPRIHRLSEAHAKDLAEASGQLLVTTDFRAPQSAHGL